MDMILNSGDQALSGKKLHDALSDPLKYNIQKFQTVSGKSERVFKRLRNAASRNDIKAYKVALEQTKTLSQENRNEVFRKKENSAFYLSAFQCYEMDMSEIWKWRTLDGYWHFQFLKDFAFAIATVENYGETAHSKAQIFAKHAQKLSDEDYQDSQKLLKVAKQAQCEWRDLRQKGFLTDRRRFRKL